MNITQTGVVLFTEHYGRAVEFYEKILGLSIRERKPALTVFDFGGSYLMVEGGGFSSSVEKNRRMNPTVLRLDVDDFDHAVLALRDQLISVSVGDSRGIGQEDRYESMRNEEKEYPRAASPQRRFTESLGDEKMGAT